MLNTIIDLLISIGSFFDKIFSAVEFLVTGLFEAIEMGLQAITFGTSSVALLPVVWAVPFLSITTICIIFKVKG